MVGSRVIVWFSVKVWVEGGLSLELELGIGLGLRLVLGFELHTSWARISEMVRVRYSIMFRGC